jgi:hypothetical protein
MPPLPIRRLVIYKHGVGYFERRGAHSGTALRLSFAREAMDDVLKSLVALDLGSGQVLGVDFETPEDRALRVSRGSIHLSDGRSLLDLLRDLRGRPVRLTLGKEFAEGLVLGVDLDERDPLKAPLVSLFVPETRAVRPVRVRDVDRVELLDERAADDVAYFLRASQSEEDRRAATLRLSEGEHDLLVGYVAPAPAWRVSYRILFENDEATTLNAEQPGAETPGRSTNAASTDEQTFSLQPSAFSVPEGLQPSAFILLQGWGLFDNQLDEDLENVALTLVAGMPVSFRYRLYEPHTPERPLVVDETRTVAGPIEYQAMVAEAPPPAAPQMLKRARAMPMADAAFGGAMPAAEPMMALDAAESSTQAAGSGEERGALFQYRVAHPVSVARGQSAMVPIVSRRLHGRKELLYNGAKQPRHPVASLRMPNDTGLTLERGPATVIEHGDYAGEAVLPFTRAGAELIIPFAVELGVSVVEEHGFDRETASVGVRGEYLLVEEWHLQRTTYKLASTLGVPAVVTIEQPRLVGYELHATPQPAEQSQGMARWTVDCPPGAETSFTVRQRIKTVRQEYVRGLSGQQLREFLRGRFLDEATFQALGGVLATYARIEQAQTRIQQIEQERQRLYRRQQQTQGSLTPLGREGDEGALRTRYVALLGELEDQLGALGAEEERLKGEITRLEAAAAKALKALSR